MHRLRHRKLLFLVALLVLCSSTFADEIRGLQELYATVIPAEIRRNFDQTTHTHKTCPECQLGVVDGEKFLGLYTKKFLVTDVAPNSFGGIWAIIVVEGEPGKAYQLWLYDIADDEYDLRTIEELPESSEDELIRQLRSAAYRQYWM